MKPTDIYYFSGTGNTLVVARELQATLTAHDIETRLCAMEGADPAAVDPGRTLGLGFPVACSSTYPLVWRFIDQLPEVTGTDVFMFDTLAAFSGGVVGPLRRVLKRKGYHCIGAREFKMPSNWLNMKDDAVNVRCIDESLPKVRAFGKALAEGHTHWGRVPILSDLTGLAGRLRIPWRLFRRWVSIDRDTCTKCGLCVTLCPVRNWRLNDTGEPVSRDRCQLCMRCVSYCPVNAIRVHGKAAKTYRALDASDLTPAAPRTDGAAR